MVNWFSLIYVIHTSAGSINTFLGTPGTFWDPKDLLGTPKTIWDRWDLFRTIGI